jgi:CRISPR-associated endoribonuclease Cas6
MVQEMLNKVNKSDKLQSIVVELAAGKNGKPPATLGRAIHGSVLHWISLGDKEIADKIHQSDVNPLSLSGLIGFRRKPVSEEGDRFFFRISLLDGSLINSLILGVNEWENQPLILGNFPLVIRQVYMIPNSHSLAKGTDYYSLVNDVVIADEINLKFLSPTSFKQKQGIQTFPLPDLVFDSLLRRWNLFAPKSLHFPEIKWEGLVSAFELKTHALKLEGGAEIGCQGWVKYHFSNREQARIASILANFAFFAGVGRKTAMGLGQTQVQKLINYE